MEIDIMQLASGGAAVGIAWAVKEMLPYLRGSHLPNDQWREYCKDKFESISQNLLELKMNDELLRAQLVRLESEVTKLGK